MRASALRGQNWIVRGAGFDLAILAFAVAGGTGFMVGDGRLSYSLERILEVYYRWQPIQYVQVSPGYQFIQNPAYNRDRGPAHVLELHLRFNY